MAKFSLVALKDEIVSDTQTLGYKNSATADDWRGDQAIADLLNDPANGAQITRKAIQPQELKASLDLPEFVALSQGQRDYLMNLFSGTGIIDANEAPIFGALTSLFPAGTTTRTSLLAKIQRQGSRAEVLWDEGITISAGQVGRAFNEI